MQKKKKIIFLSLMAVLAALILACLIYVSDFYPANSQALRALESTETVTVERTAGHILFSPARPEAGFIFYPGGKVEHIAYAPLMSALAEKNILCVLIQSPANLAILDTNAAKDIPEQFPEITKWYVGGHSLGGTAAASFAADHPEMIRGLVLLASYSTQDLRDSGLQVLSVYGSADEVLNRDRYQENFENLPENASEIVIRGGNHAFFGSYGLQEGDGLAAITAGEQLALTAAYLHTFFT